MLMPTKKRAHWFDVVLVWMRLVFLLTGSVMLLVAVSHAYWSMATFFLVLVIHLGDKKLNEEDDLR